ncbi:MAG: DUF2793 domain-containing protein [Roseobacter sp.]
MADTSHSLSLPFIAPSQAQKHVTHNEALRILDVLTQLAVISDDETTPSQSATEGARFIVGNGARGDWSGRDGEVALFETGSWRFFVPQAGWRAYVSSRETLLVHDGIDWLDLDSAELQDIEAFGLGMIAPSDTPFSVKLNTALWTALYQADGGSGDLIQTVNKEQASNAAGLIFQSNFETRALLGLFGSDDLRLATTADGVNFQDGWIVDGATGGVSQPNLPRFKGGTNFDNFTAVDTWQKIAINTLDYNDQASFDADTNAFTAPSDGTYTFGAALTFKQNVSDQARMGARLVVNGTTPISGSVHEATGPHITERTSLNLTVLTALAAGDTVELQGIMRDFDGFFLADQTTFWGYKIG